MGTVPPISSLLDARLFATLLSIVALLGLSAFSLTSSNKRAKATLLALALMVFPFLPASNLFFPVGFVVAERVLYLPSMGFCMLVALGAWLIVQNGRKLVLLSLLVCVSIHSLKTVIRNGDWKNDNSLFRSAICINGGNGKLYNNLGHDYEEKGDYVYAEKLFRMASQVQPDDIGAFINLGRMLRQLGKYQEAEQVKLVESDDTIEALIIVLWQAYLDAIELMPSGKSFRVAPSHINVYYNLANLIKMDPSRLQEAFRLYQRAISMKPNFIEAHMNKGDLLLHMNQTDEAKQAFETALRHNPDYTDAHYNLGGALLQLGKRDEAKKSYRRALALDANHIHSLLGLASLLQEDNQTDDAFQL